MRPRLAAAPRAARSSAAFSAAATARPRVRRSAARRAPAWCSRLAARKCVSARAPSRRHAAGADDGPRARAARKQGYRLGSVTVRGAGARCTKPIASPAAPRCCRSQRVGAAIEVLLCSGFPTQLLLIGVLSSSGMRMQTESGGCLRSSSSPSRCSTPCWSSDWSSCSSVRMASARVTCSLGIAAICCGKRCWA